METKPSWVKAAQNAAKGEARSKSFLLDRFWILERSVDIHGADFIIQRRLTNENILDRNAPRFGVIQAKFTSTTSTTHYINCDYVIDSESNTRDEFFLLIHTGDEDNPQMYFLTTEDIENNFTKVTQNGTPKYKISGSIINNEIYKVTSRKDTLDKIEDSLIKADFAKNRRYLTWALPSSEISIDDISPDFSVSIDNFWGNIPEAFYETKVQASKAVNEIEQIFNVLKNIATSSDPSGIIDYLEDLRFYCRGGNDNWYISIPNDIYNEDFIEVVQRHNKIIQALRENKRLDDYIQCVEFIKNDFIDFLCSSLPFSTNKAHESEIKLNTHKWEIISIDNKLIEYEFDSSEISKSSYNYIELDQSILQCIWKPLKTNYGCKTYSDEKDQIINNCRYFSAECMMVVINKLLGTEF